ncbi:MAG: hypothetical protein WAM62_05660, partial [Pseudolabrys sp.]
AMGELALAWNGLHDTLGRLFWTVLGRVNYAPLEVWYSSKVDRAQREMLRAAINSRYANKLLTPQKPREEIEWILNEATKIEDRRNDALHSPLILLGTKKKSRVVPSYHFGHTRAERLNKVDILREFRWFRDTATALRDYAGKIEGALSRLDTAWPDRPQLPNRGDHKKQKQRLPKS